MNALYRIHLTLLASFPLLVVGFVVPLQVYLPNQTYFQHQHRIILYLFGAQLLAMLVIRLLLAVIPKRVGEVSSRLLFFAGIFVLISSLVVPASVGELTGHNYLDNISEPVGKTVVELILLAIVIIFATRAPWERVRVIGSVLSALILLGSAIIFAMLEEEPENSELEIAAATAGIQRKTPNIYHFVFDAFDSIYFVGLAEKLALSDQFHGFTFYPNNFTNYTTTTLSVPSFMTGTFLEGPLVPADFNKHSDGLIQTLSTSGYRTSQYSMFADQQYSAGYRVSSADIEGQFREVANLVKLLDLSLMVAAPNFLQDESFSGGFGLVSRLLRSRAPVLADWQSRGPIISLMMVNRFLEEEPARQSTGEYVLIHVLLPHAPYALDAECRYIGRQSQMIATEFGKANLQQQTGCAIRKMGEVVERLEGLGRLDPSLVIFHSDHGEVDRIRSLLMVKGPQAERSEPLVVSSDFTHLLDLAPTILDGAGIGSTRMTGTSVLRGKVPSNRMVPLAIGLSKTVSLRYYTVSEGEVVRENDPILRKDLQ